MTQSVIENQEIQTEIQENNPVPNAFFIQLPEKGKKLRKEIIDSLKTTYSCLWKDINDDNKKRWIGSSKNKSSVSAYLSREGIEYTLEDIHDPYHDMSPSQQKQERLLNVKHSKTLKFFKATAHVQTLLDDYNSRWGTELKLEDLKKKVGLIDKLKDENQRKNFQTLCEEYHKIDQSRTEIKEIEEQVKDTENSLVIDTEKWPFTILGLNYSMEILISYNGKLIKWPVERLNEARMMALFGKKCIEWVKIRNAMIFKAHEKGMIDDESPIKCGIWKFKEKWLIVSGKHAATIENGEIKELKEPVFNGKILELDSADWIDWDYFIEIFGKSDINTVFDKIREKVLSWNWQEKSMADYITAFIMLLPMQKAMSWIPWIYLTGSKGTGKSTFFEYILQAIYGSLTEKLDKSTAHATAQTIGNTCKSPIFDEFEKHKHIPEILELAKLFNKPGGRKTSGTPGPNANSYHLHHLAWFGSIYLPRQLGQDAAQESRMVKFELKKLNNETPLLEKIEDKEASRLASEILASVISNWEDIENGARDINNKRKEIFKKLPGVEIRTIENFMYSSSLLKKVTGKDYTIPEWSVRQIEDDGDRIINTILSSMVKIGQDSYSITEVLIKIKDNMNNNFFITELTKYGLKLTSKDGVNYVAFKCENITRYLLKDTDFKEADIQAPLSRIEGAKPSEQVKGLNRCVLIPLKHIELD